MARDPEVKTYNDLRTHLESYNGTTIVMFFDPEANNTRKNNMIKDVNEMILSEDAYKDYKFMQC